MTPTREERIEKVKQFDTSCESGNFTKLAPHVYELKGPFSKTLTLCTLIHGNEIGGIEIFLNLLKMIHSKKIIPRSNLRFILGNINAYYEDKRYLETDLNRSFNLDNPTTLDELRAREIERFLKDSDVFIDIHQTIGPTNSPFFIFEFDQKSYNLAKFLNPELPVVTNTKKRAFKGMTSTAYTISNGVTGITLETGQKGIEDTQITLGFSIARKAIESDFETAIPKAPLSNTYTFSQIIDNHDGSLELVKQFTNFDIVKKGELLAKNEEKEILSQVDGVILFPKYGAYARASIELALILKNVQTEADL